jgi:putative phosphoesterase
MLIGVISDTHGLLRPEAVAALKGVDHILHAGDVGDAGILGELRKIAPVTAIRGNVDTHGACAELPAVDFVELAGKVFYLVHSVHWLDINPVVAGVAVVVSGHSHKPEIETQGGVIYLNPGSAGSRRFKLPVTMGMVEVVGDSVAARIVELLS